MRSDRPSPSRRGVLKATALTAAVPFVGAARPAPRHTARIDTHHHVLTPAMRAWAIENGLLPPTGGPRWGRWNLAETVRVMDANRIEFGVASAPAPSEAFRERKLAASGPRLLNEALADLARDHPTRFGFFAYLPLLHPDLALREAAYALDELGADGVLMMNSADGRYLGDRAFEPVFAELNRRRAVVFTHPSEAPSAGTPVPGVANWVAEYMLDTTRNALSLIGAGVVDRYPRISFILSHAGGFLPYAAARVEHAGRQGEGPSPTAFRRALRRFHYDTAMPSSPYATPTLLAAVGAERILFGTDWAQVAPGEVAHMSRAFEHDPALNDRQRAAISRGNALRLFPRIAERLG